MKRRLSMFVAIIMMFSLMLTGCGGNANKKKGDVVTIRAAFVENATVDYASMPYWDKIEEECGVRFEIEEMSTEKISLMFTSGDFVDVLFGGGCTDSQIQLAANSGDVVELTDELLSEHAPTWKKAFDENPDFFSAAKFDGNKLFSLPYIRTFDADRGVRDVWWINQTWLDELNLSMPKTLNDFENILRAFKNNAGTGTIPENVMPWYFCMNSIIGGQFDFLATFGLEAYDYTYMALDGNGTVVNYATDTRLKSAVQAMASMYAEGLIAPESLTENATQYSSRVQSGDTPYIGVCTSYTQPTEDYVPMTLFQSVEGVEPKIRQQPLGVTRNRMVLFETCEYPEKVLEVMEWIVQEENQIYTDFGNEGDGWDYDADADEFVLHVAEENYVTAGNAVPGLMDDRFNGRVVCDDDHVWAQRQKAIELYGDNRIELSHIIPPMSFTSDAQEKADNYKLVIFQRYVNSKMNSWVSGAEEVTADWDEYVSQVKSLGLDAYIQIYQETYDNYAK